MTGDDVKPLSWQEAEFREVVGREATFYPFTVRCSGCGRPGWTPCVGCPRAPVPPRRSLLARLFRRRQEPTPSLFFYDDWSADA